ncbi:hypothetical protein BIW11_06984 [Tropilaelaps mercedesae]|uniref:Cytochrome c oxidase assembly factor 3 n=1 Tax=Tropilaelaps mercedesae TaxID=418985 RepID=A0A1V9XVS1_9ACAR|nr:hypothetical protein BIW11_06984 [Tropilaelaps mercedesae]
MVFISPLLAFMSRRAYSTSEMMPKVDFSKESIQPEQRGYIKQLERLNLERVQNLKKMRSKNNRLSLCLGVGVIGIYAYTLYAVNQEDLLDDLDNP